MNSARSSPLRIRASGKLACYSRPELKVERVSYQIITPSAARGLLEAVLWKPAIKWHISKVTVLNPIRFTAFRRNEVNSKAITPGKALVANGGPAPRLFADEDRAQRNTVALRDVDYVIEAYFSMTSKAGPEDNVRKFEDMFLRRVENGQHWQQPYLGCREMPAAVSLAEENLQPCAELAGTKELGLMLWDIQFSPKGNLPLFFDARLVDGIMEVPDESHVYGKASQ